MSYLPSFKNRGDSLACPLNLELDLYSGCEMGCWYCFCKDLWKIFGNDFTQVKTGDLKKIEKDLTFAFSEKPCNQTLLMLRRGYPLKIGSKSENFQELEKEKKTTLGALKLLKQYDVPLVVETKSNLIVEPEYFEALSYFKELYLIESVIPNEKIRSAFEPGVPDLESRLNVLDMFRDSGVYTSVKVEPLMPGINDSDEDMKTLAESLWGRVDSISFYNYRTSNYNNARKSFAEHGYDWDEMGKKNWDEQYLYEMNNRAFKIFRRAAKLVTTADWVNNGLDNPIPVCCGVPVKKFYKYTWLNALHKIATTGSVKYSDILLDSDIVFEKDRQMMEELWKEQSPRRFGIWDAKRVEPIGMDGNYPIFGRGKGVSVQGELDKF